MIKAGLSDLRRRRVSLESFLAGEALTAMEILWITERSRRSIRDILQVTEKEAYVLHEGGEVSMAVDGRVVQGGAMVDEASITGMSEPVGKQTGDTDFAGTFVRQGVIHVAAEQVDDRTYLARILRMVEESLENHQPRRSF